MISARNLRVLPAGIPLLADDLVEFHAARILLLILHCGKKSQIDGLTKLAKLDFFVGYPSFFEEACIATGKQVDVVTNVVESRMVKFHYGPWDRRYYHVLSYLESRDLMRVSKEGNTFVFALTIGGTRAAEELSDDEAFSELVLQMKEVRRVFGRMNGSALKSLIYEVFDKEVAQRQLGQVIEP